jgi:hypothetical protein
MCHLPHSMYEGVAKVLAHQYAQGLEPGSTINEHDLAYCLPFLVELPEALAHHGLRLVDGVCVSNKETT